MHRDRKTPFNCVRCVIKYLLDEHLSPDIAVQGRNKGLDIVHVNDVQLNDMGDAVIWQYCLDNSYCMVSADIGFRVRAETALRKGIDMPGYFAVEQHLRPKSGIGQILEMLIFITKLLIMK